MEKSIRPVATAHRQEEAVSVSNMRNFFSEHTDHQLVNYRKINNAK